MKTEVKHTEECKANPFASVGCTCGATLENMTDEEWQRLDDSLRAKREEERLTFKKLQVS